MKLLSKVLIAASAVIAVKGLDNRLEISRYVVNSDKLPDEFDGFKILQLSDFHCDTTAGLSEAVRNEQPDIICMTGDMTHDIGSCEPFLYLLKQINDIAPIYLISGNHDVWRNDYQKLIEKCRTCGAIVLQDEMRTVTRGNAAIGIAGIEDPSSVNHDTILKKINNALSNIHPIEGFNMLLFHRANLLDMFADTEFDLILSGHMHGGQFRIPGIGGVVSPKTNIYDNGRIFFPKYFGGEYTLNNIKMIVSRGIGNPTILPRFFNRPEICTITLKKKPIEALAEK